MDIDRMIEGHDSTQTRNVLQAAQSENSQTCFIYTNLSLQTLCVSQMTCLPGITRLYSVSIQEMATFKDILLKEGMSTYKQTHSLI